jgi:hypothetical protein
MHLLAAVHTSVHAVQSSVFTPTAYVLQCQPNTMPPPPHFVIAHFFEKLSRQRVNCKLCGWGLSYKLPLCARHVFGACEAASYNDKVLLLQELRDSEDIHVLDINNGWAFRAHEVELLERQQAWRQTQQLLQQQRPQQPPSLLELAATYCKPATEQPY